MWTRQPTGKRGVVQIPHQPRRPGAPIEDRSHVPTLTPARQRPAPRQQAGGRRQAVALPRHAPRTHKPGNTLTPHDPTGPGRPPEHGNGKPREAAHPPAPLAPGPAARTCNACTLTTWGITSTLGKVSAHDPCTSPQRGTSGCPALTKARGDADPGTWIEDRAHTVVAPMPSWPSAPEQERNRRFRSPPRISLTIDHVMWTAHYAADYQHPPVVSDPLGQ
jgi:hypothetical protein